MIRRFLPLCAFIIACLATPLLGQLSFGNARLINDGWLFALGDPEGAADTDFTPNGWQTVDLPHDWSIEQQMDPDLAAATGFLPGGVAWYRKTLNIERDPQDPKVFLYFEGVYNYSEVYLNGHLLGKRPNGYVSFAYDATPYVLYGQPNTLAVRVDHSKYADSRWYTGSGIYRNVWLVRSGLVHIAQWGVFAHAPIATADHAQLEIDVELSNESQSDSAPKVKATLLAKDGTPVASATGTATLEAGASATARLALDIKHPELWDLESPYLYKIKTELFDQEGNKIDGASIPFGIRALGLDPDHGMFLNGKPITLKGVCLHHDAGALGSAVPKEVWRQRIEALKSIGCNAIRTSHNPQAPALYELCDELGMLVLDEVYDEWEFPKRKWIKGWNKGEPRFEGPSEFFNEWAERDMQAVVRRDRNHACVFAWSIGNEVDYPNDPYSHPVLDGAKINQPMHGGYKPEQPDANRLGSIAKRLVHAVKELDTSRPVTAGLAGVVMSNETSYPGQLDITGYNYTEDRYELDHKKYPGRIIYGSETGHSMDAWKAVRDHEFIFGQFLWTGIDYLGESRGWPARGFYSGLLDFTGAVKPRGHFRAGLWKEDPTIYIGTQAASKAPAVSIDAWPMWNYSDGEQVRVFCYTNAAQAKLVLNGKDIGDIKPHNDETGVISWDIPYAAGKLEAVALDSSGTEQARYAIHTAGEAQKMELQVTDMNPAPEREVVIASIQIVDAQGNPVMSAENAITCSIDGPVKLLALEAANNRDTGDYTDNVQAAYHGRLVAYLETTGETGNAKVQFSAEGLPTKVLKLEIR